MKLFLPIFQYIDPKTGIAIDTISGDMPTFIPPLDILLKANDIIGAGTELFDSWTNLSLMEPPDNILGRILWMGGVIGQLIISLKTFPAALGAFLLEESVQAMSMGAFMLHQSKSYETLDVYLPIYKNYINTAQLASKNLATLSPITGGAVIMYMEAAQLQWNAMRLATDKNLIKQAEQEEELRQKLLESQIYGDLRLTSTPSEAEIWINGENTELLTPETFKDMEEGSYDFQLRKFSVKRDVWEIYFFTVNIEAGRRKEIHIRIPPDLSNEDDSPDSIDTDDQAKLPILINAEVEGEYAIDGDTFITTTGERIRILGIDAPEINLPWGDVSKDNLTNMVEDKKIQLQIQTHKPIDTFGRTLAICKNYKGNIAIFQLSSGLARTYFSDDDIYDTFRYVEAEEQAKARGVGIWS